MKLSSTIRRLRTEELKLSQDKFSKKIGVSRKHLSEMENGIKKPSDKLLEKIAEVTGYSLGYLELIALGDSVNENKKAQYNEVMSFFKDAFDEATLG